MNGLHAAYVVLFAGAAIACLGSVVQTRRLASREVRLGLVALLVLSGLWALASVVQFLVPGLAAKRWAHVAGLVVGFGTVFAWLYFVSAYTGRAYHRDPRAVAAAGGFYGVATLVKVTNPLHGAYFSAALSPTPFRHMAVSYGSVHWLLMGLAYALSGVGLWALYDSFRERETPLTLYLLAGTIAVPVVPTLVGSLFPDLLLGVTYEPLGVAVFAVGVLFFAEDSFLELSTPGHSQLVDILSEGVLLLDDDDTVVSYNDHAAAAYPSLTAGEDSLAALDDALAGLSVGDQHVVSTSVEGTTRHYQATKKVIEAGPQFISAAVTLTDVTRLVHLEERTRVRSEVNEAIVEASTERAAKEKICEVLAEVDGYRFVWFASADGDSAAREHAAGDPGSYLDEIGLEPSAGDADPVVEVVCEEERYPGVVEVDADGGGWHSLAAARDVTACMTLSLEPGEDCESVLGVYTTDGDGFSEAEQATFAEIRETLQHALAAIEAHEEARRYQEAVNQAGYGLFIMDADGTIRYVNPAFEEITGYDGSEAVGRTPELLSNGDGTDSGMWTAVAAGSIWEGEVHNRRKGGERYWAHRTVAPVTDERGDVTAVIAIEVDITDQRVRDQRLDVLDRVVRHNLRNGMNVITGNARLALARAEGTMENGESAATENGESADIVGPIQNIEDTAWDLMQLSEKAHTAERLIGAGEGTDRTVDVGEVFDIIGEKLSAEFPDADLDVAPPTSAVTVDAALEPALFELAHNALEHNDGDPSLRVEATVDGDGEEVTVRVADDGPGLPTHEWRVLESGDESALKHGSGLGLWLANWLVLQCGGSLHSDVDDGGTTITVRVPVRTATAPAR